MKARPVPAGGCISCILAALLLLSVSAPPASALPEQQPDDTWMVNGPVRSLAQVESTIWIGGAFTELRSSAYGGSVIPVNGIAALDAATGAPIPGLHLPMVSGPAPIVYDLDFGGGVLYAGGKFSRADGVARRNVLAIDPIDGTLLPFSAVAPVSYGVLADPAGGVYVAKQDVRRYHASGTLDDAFEIQVPSVSSTSANGAAILDLTFAPDGDLLISGAFDLLNGEPHRVVSKLDPVSGEPRSWGLVGALGTNPRGIDMFVDASRDALFLAVGGSDFAGRYRISDGRLAWKIDTSGASQGIAPFGPSSVIVGGHFKWVAAARGIRCGSNTYPTGDCERRVRLAAFDAETGDLDPSWDPVVKPFYFGVWSVLAEAGRLHVGGEFTEIEGATRAYYGRFSDLGL